MNLDGGVWSLVYHGFDPAQQGLREVLCTLGNGHFATRGAAPEAHADGVSYPGTGNIQRLDRILEAEGVHLGAMAGTVDLVQRAVSGMQARGDVLWFDPAPPVELELEPLEPLA